MADCVRAILGSSRLPVVWSMVRCRNVEHPDQEPGGLEEDHLHPDVRRKRRILRSRSAIRGAGSGESGVGQDVAGDRRRRGISDPGTGSETQSEERRSRRPGGFGLSGSAGGGIAVEPRRIRVLPGVRPHVRSSVARKHSDPAHRERDTRDQYQRMAADCIRRPGIYLPAIPGRTGRGGLSIQRCIFPAGSQGPIHSHAVRLQEAE